MVDTLNWVVAHQGEALGMAAVAYAMATGLIWTWHRSQRGEDA